MMSTLTFIAMLKKCVYYTMYVDIITIFSSRVWIVLFKVIKVIVLPQGEAIHERIYFYN